MGPFFPGPRKLFPNPKRVALDFVSVACKHLLTSRQVFLMKKFCLNVAENVKCRNSWPKLKAVTTFFFRIFSFCVWPTDSVFVTTGKQFLSIFTLEHDFLVTLNQEFRHFTFSATFKQNFFIRKTCLEVNKCLQATKTKSKATLFGFGKSLRGPRKNAPTHLQTLEFLGIPHIVRS